MLRQLRQRLFSYSPAAPEAPSFTLPEGVRAYAVGDIHGRSHLLARMLEAIALDVADNPPAQVVEVFLGDYIDRGLHSREVIDLLLSPPPQGHERICLMGNHEEALLNFLNQPSTLRSWGNVGGYATLQSYGITIPESMAPERLAVVRDTLRQRMPAEHGTFLRRLPLSYVLGDYLFVHAGILPYVPLAAQRPEHLLWIRDPFLRHEGFFDYYVVHGHSPVAVPEIHPHRANLDISDAAVSSLCCLVVEGTEQRLLVVSNAEDGLTPRYERHHA